MDIKDSYLHGTIGVVKSINVNADELTYTLADKQGTQVKVTLPQATVTTNGVMSNSDKVKLDNLNIDYFSNIVNYKISLPDNSGRGVYILIAKLSYWVEGKSSDYGIVGRIVGCRGGNQQNTCCYNLVAMLSSFVYNNVTTFTKQLYIDKHTSYCETQPCVVTYNGENYLALKKTGSGTYIYFEGAVKNILPQSQWIVLNTPSGKSLPDNMTVLHSANFTNAYSITTSKYYDGAYTRALLHSGNYTEYVNTTNFQGLDKIGTVTSVTVKGENGLSGTGTVTTSGTITLSNSGVRSISTGTENGTISVNTNGNSADVAVKGLGSAAYTNTSLYQKQSTYVNNTGEVDVYKKITITKSDLDGYGVWLHSRKQHYLLNSGAYAMSSPLNTFWELGTDYNNSGGTRSISVKMIATASSANITLYVLVRAYTYLQVVTSGTVTISDSTNTEYEGITSSTSGWVACTPAKWTDTTYSVVSNSANGLAPKVINTNTASVGSAYYVLASSNGSATPSWYKLPSNAFVNDDTKVTQTKTTSDKDYRVILSKTDADTSETDTVLKSENLTFNPKNNVLSAGTVTATKSLIISNNSNAKHILFSRGKDTDHPYNYIAAPEGGYICILPNGVSNSSTSGMQFTDEELRPATNAAYSLGTKSLKWDNVYANNFKGNLDWSYIINKPTSFTPSAHTHSYITIGDSKDASEKSSSYTSGALSINKVYNDNYPLTYGNTMTIVGSGSGQMFLSWSGTYTDSDTQEVLDACATELYLRNKRDNQTVWTGWTRVLTNKNYGSYVAAKSHTHPTSNINSLTGYTKATAIGSIATSDSLNTALGKLEYKTDFIYNDLFGTDNDDVINKWHEIVDFVDSVAEGTDITEEFVTKKTDQTITGLKTFSGNPLVAKNAGNLMTLYSTNNWNAMSFIINADNEATRKYSHIVMRDDSKFVIANSVWDTEYLLLHGGNTNIKNGVITIAGQTITPLTSHQSLANYVTLDTAQTITGEKTFTSNITLSQDSSGVYFYGGCGIEKWSGYGPTLVSEGDNLDFYIRKQTDRTDYAKILHSKNYTTYVNTTNFPGLNSTGTVTSIEVGATSYSPSSGVVSLPAYPTSLKSPNAIKFKTTAGSVASYDGSVAVDLTGGINYATDATNLLIYKGLSSDTYTTVKAMKDQLKVEFGNVKQCVGSAINIPHQTISNWDNESFAFNSGGTYTAIKLSGGYSGNTYGQWLLSAFGDERLYYVGLYNGEWTTLRKIAITNDIPTKTSHLENDSGFLTSRGYIGTTAVQASSASQNLTGIGNLTMSGNLTITSGNTDKFINFSYNDANAHSWRLGYLGTGNGEANYFVVQSAKASGTSWNNAIRLGNETLDAAFGGNVYPLTTNTQTLGTQSLKWSNVYATTFTGNLTGNVTGNADTATTLKPTTLTLSNSGKFNLSNTDWTDTGYTFANLTTGTYAVQVTSGTNLVASGIMSVYTNLSDTVGDEIPLHVYGTADWRPYLRTYQNKLQISSNDTSSTSRTVTIKIAQIL